MASGLFRRLGSIFLDTGRYKINLDTVHMVHLKEKSVGFGGVRPESISIQKHTVPKMHVYLGEPWCFEKGTVEFDILEKYLYTAEPIPGFQESDFVIPQPEVDIKPAIEKQVSSKLPTEKQVSSKPTLTKKQETFNKKSNGFSF